MEPRRLQLRAPRPGDRRPAAGLLALLLWLALQGAATMPAGPGGPEDPEQPQDAGLPRGILQQAARAALHFFNFRAGSPSALRVLAAVQNGRARVDPKQGCTVDLVFSTECYNLEEGEQRLGKCSAHVFFKNQKPRPAVNITCTRFTAKKKRQDDDYLLYKRMRQLQNPLDAVSIPDKVNQSYGDTPGVTSSNLSIFDLLFNQSKILGFCGITDSHGHTDPSLRPIWDLAFLGSSYVMWEKTTQFLHYYFVQLSSVKQWKTDDAIDFDYTVLLHEFPTQEIIPCRIHLVWYPGKPLKVKYHCQELQTPEEASGTVEGSAVEPTELSNF